MANQVRFTPLAELVRLAATAKSSGCELAEILGDTSQMYPAQGALIEFYEAATPDAFLALVAMSREHMEEKHGTQARCAQLEAELSDLRSRMLEVK
ncbi:hypothetical protein [Pseudomonas sp. R1-15]|uniref:hypothetical protein n=1 Tax=Pseudomonas sp. R1-15 TaxID=2817399 RepID=UPI003DA9CEEC